MIEKNKLEKSVLYLVGTPIGNVSDISERAIKVLKEVDFIAAEDTRNTLKLLTMLGIKKELISYHEHNKRAGGERILERILQGENCALVTDAGMPAISDPGEDLVKLMAENGIKVSVIPGPSAVVSALALSAISSVRFAFEGFLPVQKSERTKRLTKIKNEERTLIFYEAPHKLTATLKDLAENFGNGRKISICRELTKLNEEVIRTTLGDAVSYYEEKEPRGEYVLVIEGAPEGLAKEENPLTLLSPEEHVNHYIGLGMKKMDAIKASAKDRGISKSEMYGLILK